ncbi:Slx4p interacting protein [Lignoscripta atroalba]|nr:Slx4p interacting protein [Lignoscripta atroalba]
MDKLSNLHLLLRVPSFARWPLEVRFFCEDVYHVWQRWSDRVDGQIRSGIKIILDLEELAEHTATDDSLMNTQAEGKRKLEARGKGGLNGLDVGYAASKPHLEKSLFMLAESETNKCSVCAEDMGAQTAVAVVCPVEGCRTASHLTCLSMRFLQEEGQGALIVPTSGSCPCCKTEMQWIDLIKEMSLRARGEKELTQLMRKPRERKTKDPKSKRARSTNVNGQLPGHDNEDYDESGDTNTDDVDEEEDMYPAEVVDEPRLDEG